MMKTTDIQKKTYAEQLADKKRRNQKLFSIILFSVVFVIVVLVIIASSIKVDLRPSLIAEPYEIRFSEDGFGEEYSKQDDVYKDIISEYNKAFKTSYLNAMFEGRLSGYEIIENSLNQEDLDILLTNKKYVTFIYQDEITLVDSKGFTYYSQFNNNNTINIKEVVIILNENNKTNEFSIFANYSTNSNPVYVELANLKANTYNMLEVFENR